MTAPDLSNAEKRVMLALADIGRSSPEEILEKGEFSLSVNLVSKGMPVPWGQDPGDLSGKIGYSALPGVDCL